MFISFPLRGQLPPWPRLSLNFRRLHMCPCLPLSAVVLSVEISPKDLEQIQVHGACVAPDAHDRRGQMEIPQTTAHYTWKYLTKSLSLTFNEQLYMAN